MQTITIKVPDDCEVQVVRKEEKKNPVIRTYQDLIDNNIKLNGYFIGLNSSVYTNTYYCKETDKNIAASEKVAKSMLAMAMISQLMPYYGGEITDEEWEDASIDKYSIISIGNIVSPSVTTKTMYYFLSFHTREQRDEFLKHNKQLVKDYLMID